MADGEGRVVLAQRPAKVIVREGERVLKIFDQNYSVADVLNEALNQARVMESGLRIPELLEVRKTPEGKWVIVMAFAEGGTLAEAMGENPGRFGELMDRFVDIQLDMNRRTVRLLNSMREKMIRQIDEAPLDPATRYDLHTRVESMPRRARLCHGDFNPTNVILGQDGGATIVDWSHATQGDPGADAARTYLLFKLLGQEAEAELYLLTFCAKSLIPRAEVQKWLPIVAACQTLKGDAAEREFLMKWVNVFDFE
ncbi:MAG: aminoglycoside phosphotransferase family protein [Deltaproteobacteria bacterium]|jgi:tRNA A-37 threonylcarbamoyl transferase component Bud32|nr:aminoglycoside phosphotransferase family protein [Deltaproteobacteria bacterium]